VGAPVERGGDRSEARFAWRPLRGFGSLSADKETDIWASSVTNSVSLHFNGTSWVRVPMAKASRVNKVAVLSSSNVWAVGQQTNDKFSQIQHFNGTVWSVVSSPHFTNVGRT